MRKASGSATKNSNKTPCLPPHIFYHLNMIRITALIALLFISACSSSTSTAPLTPLPAPVKEPSNEQLKADIQTYVRSVGAPAASGFQFNRIDLNGDGRREGLVLLNKPYGYWCEENGCQLLVFKANEDNFTFINTIKPIREPIYIENKLSHGWKNIVTRVSGRSGKAAKNVALKYNGNTYPTNPAQQEHFHAAFINNPQFIRVFN